MSIELLTSRELRAFRSRLFGCRERLARTIRASVKACADGHRLDRETLTFLLKEVRTGDYDWKMEIHAIVTHLTRWLDSLPDSARGAVLTRKDLKRARHRYLERQDADFLASLGSCHDRRTLQNVLYSEVCLLVRGMLGDTNARISKLWMIPLVLDTGKEWCTIIDTLCDCLENI